MSDLRWRVIAGIALFLQVAALLCVIALYPAIFMAGMMGLAGAGGGGSSCKLVAEFVACSLIYAIFATPLVQMVGIAGSAVAMWRTGPKSSMMWGAVPLVGVAVVVVTWITLAYLS